MAASNKKRKQTKRFSTIKPHHIGLAGIAAIAVIGLVWAGVTAILRPSDASNAATCTVTATLVNPCRPWLGAAATNYPQVASDTKSQLLYHETRIGRKLDLIHTYHPVGTNSLSSTDLYFINRTDTPTYLFANWKPAAKWADAGGGNATIDAGITKMANSIKAVKPHKIFLTIHHEPENDVSSGASGCTTYKGSAGTPAQYRAMWAHVRQMFTANGTDNVVWVMDFMNYSQWDCMIDDVYPGDSLVDWIMFNGYGVGSDNFRTNIKHFTDILNANSVAPHNYKSKTWGIVEWSYRSGAGSSAYFDQAKAVLDSGEFPLKAYMVYDSRAGGSSTGLDSRVAYDDAGNYSATEAAHYAAFANDPKIVGDGGQTPVPPPPPPPPSDTSPPVVSLNVPATGATESGTIQVQGSATDNVSVKTISLQVDGATVQTATTNPVSFNLATTAYSDGDHVLALRATDPSGNVGQSNSVTIHVHNQVSTPVPPPPVTPPPVTVVTPGQPSSPASPVPVTGQVVVQPADPGASLDVYVDDKKIDGNVVDTSSLTNGTHKVTTVEDGNKKDNYIQVANPFLQSILNNVRANIVAYVVGFMVVMALGITLILRKFVFTGASTV